MALDREDTLKKAEKLLRQGRLDAAIAEYVRVVEDQPRDWNTANTLGDLFGRAGQPEKAVAQYVRIADHFLEDGFYPKAAALYKKILKITPDAEETQLKLADLSARQGLLRDAKVYYGAIIKKRRERGDNFGADQILVKLADLDPSDFEARLAGARALAESNDEAGAAARYRQIHDDLLEKGRTGEALAALREAVKCNPADSASRAILAKEAIASGDVETARAYLDRQTAGADPALLTALIEIELRSGQLEHAREILPELVAGDAAVRARILELAWELAAGNPDAAFVCIDCVANTSTAAGEYDDAAAVIQEFVTRVPAQIPALLKLVEICVDGGLETTMYETQAQLADAYLATGQAAEARVIAEDLVAREPWERAHIERFRRALVLLRVSEPDSVIADRLSGQSPFMATDHFSDQPSQPPVPDPVQPHSPLSSPVSQPMPDPPPPPQAAAVAPPAEDGSSAPALRVAASPPRPSPEAGTTEIDLTSALGSIDRRAAAGPRPVAAAPPVTAAPPLAAAPPVIPVPPPDAGRPEPGAARGEVLRPGGPDQAAQHMKLAATYMEMGLVDEAIVSLKMAARSPRHRFEAAGTLGRLYRERGDLAYSIEWLEQAVEAPASDIDEARGLLYEFGATLEAAGETARALAVFMELQADAGEYRDVAARVDHLARVQTGG